MTRRAVYVALLLLGAGALGCGAAGGASLFGLVCASATALALVLAQGWARAGAPMQRPRCDGVESRICSNGAMVTQCCPKGAQCNFSNPAHVECGYGRCVLGTDVGRCPAQQAFVTEERDLASCQAKYGNWTDVCVSRHVTKACIRRPHTNYSGPPMNPPFRTCGPASDRCTTHVLVEDCYPAKGEISDAECAGAWAGQWTKVCLGGTISERCLPRAQVANAGVFPSTSYVKCGKPNSCAGGDKNTAGCAD